MSDDPSSIRSVMGLRASITTEGFQRMLHGRRLLLCPRGKYGAIVTKQRNGKEVVKHSHIHLQNCAFDYPDNDGLTARTTLIDVGPDSVRLWGRRASDGQAGVFIVARDMVWLECPMDRLVRIQPTPRGDHLVFGQNIGGTFIFVTVPGIQDEVSPIAHACMYQGELCVLDRVEGNTFAYSVDVHKRIDAFADVPVLPGEYLHTMVVWRDTFYAAFTQKTGSSILRRFSVRSNDTIEPDMLPIRGRLRTVWQSPTGRSIATLSEERTDGIDHRLLGQNGVVFAAGDFFMNPDDLVWSPDEELIGWRTVSARIDAYGKQVQTLATMHDTLELESRTWASEFLIDNYGNIAAYLLNDGQCVTPVVYGQPRPACAHAWNINWDSERINYNVFDGDRVIRVTDPIDPNNVDRD